MKNNHSPKSSRGKKGQEEKDAKLPQSSGKRDKKLSRKGVSLSCPSATVEQDSSPSSFEKEFNILTEGDWSDNELKDLVEKWFVEKQKVKEFLDWVETERGLDWTGILVGKDKEYEQKKKELLK